MRRTVLFLALILTLCGCSLARPEQDRPEQDRFVGFHLVYAPLPEGPLPPSEQVEGREDETGHFVFSGLEGQNCFVLRRTGESERYLASCFQVSSGGLNLHYSDEGEAVDFQAEAFCGPAEGEELGPEEDYACTAYRVYQRPDGSVYLNRYGDAFPLASGASQTEQVRTPYLEEGKSLIFEMNAGVTFRAVPRTARCVIRQLDKNGASVREDVLTAREAEALGEEEARFPLEPEAVCVMSVCEYEGGGVLREMHALSGAGEGERLAHLSPRFLDSRGLGYYAGITVEGPQGNGAGIPDIS